MCGIFRKLRKKATTTHFSIIIILVITIVFAFSLSLSSCTESEESSNSSSTTSQASSTSKTTTKLTTTVSFHDVEEIPDGNLWMEDVTTTPAPLTTTSAKTTKSTTENTTTVVKPTATTTVKPTTPAPTPAPTTKSTTTAAEYNDFENEVLRLVNIERANEGLKALLKGDATIYSAAQVRAKEIKTYFSHTRPGSDSSKPGSGNIQWYTVFDEFRIKYRNVGENLAKGHTSPKAVVEGWMNSPGHRDNIMKKEYTHLSVALYKEGGINYWVQLFIAY